MKFLLVFSGKKFWIIAKLGGGGIDTPYLPGDGVDHQSGTHLVATKLIASNLRLGSFPGGDGEHGQNPDAESEYGAFQMNG